MIELTWESFQDTYLGQEAPAALTIADASDLRLFVRAGSSAIGFSAPIGPNDELPGSPLRAITITATATGSDRRIEMATSSRDLYREFFFFALAVADVCETSHVDICEGLRQALNSWRGLLRSAARLSEEQEIGLFGELLVLERMLIAGGAGALRAWTGPLGEPHDFRLPTAEFEVKTTRSTRRSHIINGIAQLEPSAGRQLYILSLQIEPAGSDVGRCLPEQIEAIQTLLASDGQSRTRFIELVVQTLHYHPEDRALYDMRYRLRSKVSAVPVNSECPRLTRHELSLAQSAEVTGRIEQVEYRVNLDGLGWEEGTVHFREAVPFWREEK